MKTLLATVLAVLFWIPFVQASPIDDASQYSVRIKSTVRYAFAGENAGTSDGAGFLIDRQRGWDAAAANECVSPSIEIVNKNK